MPKYSDSLNTNRLMFAQKACSNVEARSIYDFFKLPHPDCGLRLLATKSSLRANRSMVLPEASKACHEMQNNERATNHEVRTMNVHGDKPTNTTCAIVVQVQGCTVVHVKIVQICSNSYNVWYLTYS